MRHNRRQLLQRQGQNRRMEGEVLSQPAALFVCHHPANALIIVQVVVSHTLIFHHGVQEGGLVVRGSHGLRRTFQLLQEQQW